MTMLALLIAALVIGAVLIGVGGLLARRARITDASGQALALAIISTTLLAAPRHWSELLVTSDAADRVLALARDIGLAGLFFVAGTRVKLDELRVSLRISTALAASGLALSAVIALVLVQVTRTDWSSAILIATCIAASSVWLPSQLCAKAGGKKPALSASAVGAAVILAGALMLVVHLLGAFHEVPDRAHSISAYAIVAAYELVKAALFFSLAWFVATRFLALSAKPGARVSGARSVIGYLLIAVLVFVLARAWMGELGALAWSFIAGVVFTRSEAGERMASQRTAAVAVFLSLGFLPMFLQPHGRSVTRLPLLLGAIAAALIVKFAASVMAARVAGCSGRDARLLAASTLASGELAVALLAFGLTRWLIEGPEYFAVLFFALLSMVASPAAWRTAVGDERSQADSPGGKASDRQPRKREKSGRALKKKASLAAALVAGSLFSLNGMARAQTPSRSAQDDPVSRAMRSVEESANSRVAAAEQVLAASRLINESKVARQEGKHGLAREAVSKAESIAADGEFNRSALIEDLLRLVAEEKAALDSPARRDAGEFGSGGGVAVAVPRSVRARLEQYREIFARILDEEQVPVGLLGVALVESGFNPMALSPKGARGIWQFMPATAARYGLAVRPGDDHRTHPEHSTRAAARYLRDLYNQFRDWKLTLAAYNAGEYRVQRIIDRTGIRDFDEMSRRGLLPLETRKYVPAVLGVWGRLSGTNSLVPARARQKGETRGGVVEALVKPEDSAVQRGAVSRQ